MLQSELSIDISHNLNKKVIRVFDTSHYCNHENIENYLIEVLPVNKSVWLTFHVKKGFSLVLNSSNLRYNRPNSTSGLIDLPDGIYEFKQSYNPNTLTVGYYLHLRTTEIELKIKNERNKLIDNKCNLSKEEYKINRDKLNDIQEYVEAARFKVEEKLERKEGIELYQWAEKLLEQYTNECQC